VPDGATEIGMELELAIAEPLGRTLLPPVGLIVTEMELEFEAAEPVGMMVLAPVAAGAVLFEQYVLSHPLYAVAAVPLQEDAIHASTMGAWQRPAGDVTLLLPKHSVQHGGIAG